LEVVVVVGVDFGQRLRVPRQLEMLDRAAGGVTGIVPPLEGRHHDRCSQLGPACVTHAGSLMPGEPPVGTAKHVTSLRCRDGRAREPNAGGEAGSTGYDPTRKRGMRYYLDPSEIPTATTGSSRAWVSAKLQ